MIKSPFNKSRIEKMTDGMFEMEYDELTYRTRLYEATGFLGRNLRFSDSPSFYRLQYFIQRYLSDAKLINKVGKRVREDSEFGKIFTSREHIFAYGTNVRNLQRDLGMLILWNSKQKGYDLDDLIQLVETSNRQKRAVRIVERGVTEHAQQEVENPKS